MSAFLTGSTRVRVFFLLLFAAVPRAAVYPAFFAPVRETVSLRRVLASLSFTPFLFLPATWTWLVASTPFPGRELFFPRSLSPVRTIFFGRTCMDGVLVLSSF